MKRPIDSIRKFHCVWVECGETYNIEVTLDSIYEKAKNEDDFEYNYAMQDDIDTILDLKPKEVIYFQFNRDNKNAKGIISRLC